jgi:hypothetical protein
MSKSERAWWIVGAIVVAYFAVDFIAYAARRIDGGPIAILWGMFFGR